VTAIEGIGLGVLQGVTEFLPVSSSGHLVLAKWLFGIEGAPVAMDVLLHAASLVAIVIFFSREILALATVRRRLIPPLLVGTVPAAVLGLLLKDHFEGLFENPMGVAVGLLLTGTVLWVGERLATDSRPLDSVGVETGFWIGLAQAIGLAPGVSRSGMTVGAGLAAGLERKAAVTFAFLLGALAIGGATLLKSKAILELGAVSPLPLALGFIASLLASLGALALLSLVVRRKCLAVFAMYCYLVGAAVLLAKLARAW